MSVKTKNGNPELVLGRNAGAARPFGTVRRGAPICLDEETRKASTDKLNQILVDTISLRDLYNKHYWQVSGPTFLPTASPVRQALRRAGATVDRIAERIQALGGVSLAVAADAAENTKVPRPPKDREEAQVQISRLLEAHEMALKESREGSRRGGRRRNDLLISDVLRTNEQQVWFVSERVVDQPHAKAE